MKVIVRSQSLFFFVTCVMLDLPVAKRRDSPFAPVAESPDGHKLSPSKSPAARRKPVVREFGNAGSLQLRDGSTGSTA